MVVSVRGIDALMHLLMYRLVHRFPIVLPVLKVSCLEHPHIQAHCLESIMLSNAADCTFTFLNLLLYLAYLAAANALSANRHRQAAFAFAP